jgi:putative SOS response-associated peptidase YedK
MCGRYRRTTREEELARIYRIPILSQPNLPISYNVAPSQEVLAIRFNPETKQRSLDRLRWGSVRYWAKDEKIGFKTFPGVNFGVRFGTGNTVITRAPWQDYRSIFLLGYHHYRHDPG